MAFRVLIAGGRHFTDYPTLRTTLDALLAHRLPDVELLTTGGPGVPMMLAASYAAERGLKLTALMPDFIRFPVDTVARRDLFLVSRGGRGSARGAGRTGRERAEARAGEHRTEGDSGSRHRSRRVRTVVRVAFVITLPAAPRWPLDAVLLVQHSPQLQSSRIPPRYVAGTASRSSEITKQQR